MWSVDTLTDYSGVSSGTCTNKNRTMPHQLKEITLLFLVGKVVIVQMSAVLSELHANIQTFAVILDHVRVFGFADNLI